MFTSLKADRRQDINGGFVFSPALMVHFLEGSASLCFDKLTKRRFVFVTLLIWVNIPMS